MVEIDVSDYCDLDQLENVAQSYHDFYNHRVPGGLKVCLETAFGKDQSAN
jgi:hypothetical protein